MRDIHRLNGDAATGEPYLHHIGTLGQVKLLFPANGHGTHNICLSTMNHKVEHAARTIRDMQCTLSSLT